MKTWHESGQQHSESLEMPRRLLQSRSRFTQMTSNVYQGYAGVTLIPRPWEERTRGRGSPAYKLIGSKIRQSSSKRRTQCGSLPSSSSWLSPSPSSALSPWPAAAAEVTEVTMEVIVAEASAEASEAAEDWEAAEASEADSEDRT
ncbi:uncharacterized protein LOC134771220 [Penaeus indicus]|uniref:uncharacterized protein LOC134771220 n=1 Tax=Penaeus indicus TaxID=29960 RepID=UPI00300D28FF